jgi:NTP pyrophosphatase (non-canonical NTP hydrolase)
MPNINDLADKSIAVCRLHEWERTWNNGGCYLHLEVSEFIEALRGKGDESPASEAGDVLFVLLSMLRAHDIDLAEVFDHINKKCDALLTQPSLEGFPFKGEAQVDRYVCGDCGTLFEGLEGPRVCEAELKNILGGLSSRWLEPNRAALLRGETVDRFIHHGGDLVPLLHCDSRPGYYCNVGLLHDRSEVTPEDKLTLTCVALSELSAPGPGSPHYVQRTRTCREWAESERVSCTGLVRKEH